MAEPEFDRYIEAPITGVEVRDPTRTDDNTWTMSGYAAVFNQSTVLFDGNSMRVREQIAPMFFDDIIRNQPMMSPAGVVHFNHGHDMRSAVAATDVPYGQPGSLRLTVNREQGLHYLAKVSRDDPDGVRLAVKMRDGIIKQASFAFTIAADGIQTEEIELDDGRVEYVDTLTRGKHLYDVCACAQGAYSQTISNLHAYARMIGQPIVEMGGHQRQPDLGGAISVSPGSSGRRGGHHTPWEVPPALAARAAAVLHGRKHRDVPNGPAEGVDPHL